MRLAILSDIYAFVTLEDIFCCVADWQDHVLIGYILIASVTWHDINKKIPPM
jgi:hypothetical protein